MISLHRMKINVYVVTAALLLECASTAFFPRQGRLLGGAGFGDTVEIYDCPCGCTVISVEGREDNQFIAPDKRCESDNVSPAIIAGHNVNCPCGCLVTLNSNSTIKLKGNLNCAKSSLSKIDEINLLCPCSCNGTTSNSTYYELPRTPQCPIPEAMMPSSIITVDMDQSNNKLKKQDLVMAIDRANTNRARMNNNRVNINNNKMNMNISRTSTKQNRTITNINRTKSNIPNTNKTNIIQNNRGRNHSSNNSTLKGNSTTKDNKFPSTQRTRWQRINRTQTTMKPHENRINGPLHKNTSKPISTIDSNKGEVEVELIQPVLNHIDKDILKDYDNNILETDINDINIQQEIGKSHKIKDVHDNTPFVKSTNEEEMLMQAFKESQINNDIKIETQNLQTNTVDIDSDTKQQMMVAIINALPRNEDQNVSQSQNLISSEHITANIESNVTIMPFTLLTTEISNRDAHIVSSDTKKSEDIRLLNTSVIAEIIETTNNSSTETDRNDKEFVPLISADRDKNILPNDSESFAQRLVIHPTGPIKPEQESNTIMM